MLCCAVLCCVVLCDLGWFGFRCVVLCGLGWFGFRCVVLFCVALCCFLVLFEKSNGFDCQGWPGEAGIEESIDFY